MRVELLRWRVMVERVCVAAFMFEYQARDYVSNTSHWNAQGQTHSRASIEDRVAQRRERKGRRK